jgi:hypothetical protein
MANLFDPPGKPFGYAYIEETTRIEDHVRRRTGYPRLDDPQLRARVDRIRMRLHKYDETFAVRSRRWFNEQQERARRERNQADVTFDREELERLIEHFEGANDPVSAAIAAKAKNALDTIAIVV